MKRILCALLFCLWSQVASAGVSCTLPFTLVNNTIADASQVMANYNAILACLLRAAANGANTDITSLIGLTTPLAPSEGGTSVYNTGSTQATFLANAYTVSAVVPGNFTLTPGNVIYFITPAGGTNTGAVTWNVNGTGPINVLTRTSTGLIALSGGEIVPGVTSGYYDGVQWELLGVAPNSFVQPCTEIAYQGVAVPQGYLAENGQAVSRTAFPNLFSCLTYPAVSATTNGTTSVLVPNSALFQIGWQVGGNNVTCNSSITAIPDGTHITISPAAGASGATTLTIGPWNLGDCSTTFNVPNMNGRETVMIDTAGGTLSSVACPNPASIGTQCGSLTQTILNTNLPPYTPQGTVSTTPAVQQFNTTVGVSASSGFTVPQAISQSLTSTFTGTAAAGHNQTPFLLQPVSLALKAIKF
jgi:hypothetical protein